MSDVRDPREAERLEFESPESLHSRRDFLQRTAVAAGLSSAAGLLLAPETLVAAAARHQRQVALPSPRNLPLDTIVVLMMENRSFDHYLGWLPGADGRQAGLRYTDQHGQSHATHRLTGTYQGCGFLDPDHSWEGGRIQLDGGRVDGFLKADSDVFSIGYYGESDLGFTPHVAQKYTAYDRFFCSLLASTYPNREYMHAGQSYGMTDNSLPLASGGFPDTTIFAALARQGISNRYFYSDLPVSAFWGTAGLARSSQVQEFYERCAAGTLPAVSYVDPSFQGEDQGTSGDEHPLGDVRAGQAFISDVAHAFIESPHYQRGALFIVYDEWGGFFDHVIPPRVPDLRSSRNLDRDFGQMGFRVPATVISPFARSGHVDHSIYGFESILKLIRYRFGLPPLTPRDLYANNIAYSLDFDQPDYSNRDLPRPAHIIATACAGTTPVDSGGTGIGLGGITTQPLLAGDQERAKPHDLYDLYTSGYLDRLGFHYEPATPDKLYRHPSSMGFTR